MHVNSMRYSKLNTILLVSFNFFFFKKNVQGNPKGKLIADEQLFQTANMMLYF